METIVFTGALLVLAAVSGLGQADDHERPGRDCWPDNATLTGCFQSLPAVILRPTRQGDSYSLGIDREAFDYADFSAIRMTQHPTQMCQLRGQVLTAMQCMRQAVLSRCANLTQWMSADSTRVEDAFAMFCNQVDKVNRTCMERYRDIPARCKMMLMPNNRVPETADVSDDDVDPLSTAEPEAESSPAGQPRPWSMEQRNGFVCSLQYRRMRCLQRPLALCCNGTAKLVGRFLQGVAPRACADRMDTWRQANAAVTALVKPPALLAALALAAVLAFD